jgi:hypothetical protein
MKVHHLVHNEFASSNYSQVQGIRSLDSFFDSTKSFRKETSYFPLSPNILNKHKSSKVSLDQVSTDTNVTGKTNNECYRTFIPEDNNEISSITSLENVESSSSVSSLPKFQNFFELSLLPTIPTLNSPSLVSDLLLTNSDLWSQFYRVNNEMIITKAGRCIFPSLKFHPVNLDPTVNYSFVIDFVQVSKDRYRFKKGCWISLGPDKRKFLQNNSNSRGSKFGAVCGNPFTHPDSPQSGKKVRSKLLAIYLFLLQNLKLYIYNKIILGAYWMNFGVSFLKIKLTNRLRPGPLSAKKHDSMTNNNSSLPPGYFYLTSFHKYRPRIKMIKHSANEDQETFFTFEETTFIAVTHYQNEEVNILKKTNNPHAKGFKGSFKDQNNPYISESENSDNVIESEIDDDNEVDIEEISSDIGGKDPSYLQTTASRSSDSIPLEQKVQQWRQSVNIETSSMEDVFESNIMRGSSNDDAFHSNQTNLYQNMGRFSAKVVKNAHYSSQKHLASHERPKVNCLSTRSISISSRDFSNSGNNNNTSSNPSINPYKLSDFTDDSKYKIDYTAPKRPKLDQPISFPEVQQNKQQEEIQSQLISQQLQQKNTQQSIWNNFSVPTTPLSPGNIFFSTIYNNNESSNFGNSTSYFRLEQAKNENERLREFIRERYGVEAEKEADAVVALGRKEM